MALLIAGSTHPIAITQEVGRQGYLGAWIPQNIDRIRLPYIDAGRTSFGRYVTAANSDGLLSIQYATSTRGENNVNDLIGFFTRYIGYPVYVSTVFNREVREYVYWIRRIASIAGQANNRIVYVVLGANNIDLPGDTLGFTSSILRNDGYIITEGGRTDGDGFVQTGVPVEIGSAGVNIEIPADILVSQENRGVIQLENRDFFTEIRDINGDLLVEAEERLIGIIPNATSVIQADFQDVQILVNARAIVNNRTYIIDNIEFLVDNQIRITLTRTR